MAIIAMLVVLVILYTINQGLAWTVDDYRYLRHQRAAKRHAKKEKV